MHSMLRILKLIYFYLFILKLVSRYFSCLKFRQVCNLEKFVFLFFIFYQSNNLYGKILYISNEKVLIQYYCFISVTIILLIAV